MAEESDFVIEDGVLTKYNGAASHVVIPDGVTAIGENAFNSYGISSVVIPDSVTSIGDYAFANTRLTSVTIPAGVTAMDEVLNGCSSLTTVTFKDGMTAIPKGALIRRRHDRDPRACFVLRGSCYRRDHPFYR